MKQMLSKVKRLLYREPEIPPPVTFGYLLIAGFVLIGSIALIFVSTLSYTRSGSTVALSFVVLGLATLVIGTAELLPASWYKVSAALRVTGILLVLVTLWLFVK